MPRKKSERRQLELFGAISVSLTAVIIISAFTGAGIQSLFLRSPHSAAVVTSVLVELANGDRAAHDREPLTVSPILTAAAQAKADDMAAKQYFSHTTPEGYDSWHWFTQVGYAFVHAGENLAVDFSDSADVERAWMNSPTHRQNILNERFTEIGIATASGYYQGRPTIFVVQMFGTPAQKSSAVVHSSVPANPAQPAIATTNAERVLGESADSAGEPASKSGDESLKAVSPADSALASPHTTLRYIYIAVALIVIASLAFVTRFEYAHHHRGKYIAAGTLLVLMGVLFFVADLYFFSDAIIEPLASSV